MFNSFAIGQTFTWVQVVAPISCLMSIMQKILPGVKWDELEDYCGEDPKEAAKRAKTVKNQVLCLTSFIFVELMAIASTLWLKYFFNTEMRP